MLGFMDRAMSPAEISRLNQRIIKMIADNLMSFNWIERPSTRRFFEVLRPSSVHCMPSRRQLSGKLLENAAKSSRDDIIPEMKKLNEDFNCSYFFVCDGWVDTSKRHILGSIVAMLHLWFAHDEALGEGNVIKDDHHDGVATAAQIERAFKKTESDFGITFSGVTTDEAGQCARAKRILSLRYPNMYFGKCFAHQVNLIVKDVLKVAFIGTIERARKLVTKYNNSTNKWLLRLDKEAKALYGFSPALLRIVEVRWNSTQSSLASILRIRSALKMVEAKYSSDEDYPDDLRVDDAFFLKWKWLKRPFVP